MGQIKAWWKDLPAEDLKETAWERQMHAAGLEAYERNYYKANGERRPASESNAGQRIIRTLLDRADAAILERQKELLGVNRVDRNLRGTVLLVPSDTAALLTLKIMIDRTYASPEPELGVNWQVTCKEVSKAIEQELNFRTWLLKSREAALAYAQEHGRATAPQSIAERLITEQGANKRSLYRWRKTFEELQTYSWDKRHTEYASFLKEYLKSVPSLPTEGPVEVRLLFVMPPYKTSDSPAHRADVDNLSKLPMDCMTKAVTEEGQQKFWVDDHLVVHLSVFKRFAREGEEPHTKIRIKTIEGSVEDHVDACFYAY